jgi:hypothetical protein
MGNTKGESNNEDTKIRVYLKYAKPGRKDSPPQVAGAIVENQLFIKLNYHD